MYEHHCDTDNVIDHFGLSFLRVGLWLDQSLLSYNMKFYCNAVLLLSDNHHHKKKQVSTIRLLYKVQYCIASNITWHKHDKCQICITRWIDSYDRLVCLSVGRSVVFGQSMTCLFRIANFHFPITSLQLTVGEMSYLQCNMAIFALHAVIVSHSLDKWQFLSFVFLDNFPVPFNVDSCHFLDTKSCLAQFQFFLDDKND